MSSCKINKMSNHNNHTWFDTQHTFATKCATTIFLTPTIMLNSWPHCIETSCFSIKLFKSQD